MRGPSLAPDKAAFLRGDLARVRLCSRFIPDFETLSNARVARSEPYVANACLISGVLPASVLVKTSPLNRNGAYAYNEGIAFLSANS